MSMSSKVFTSESVSEGHPDKVCDQISDAILDACLEEDPLSHVAVETAVKCGTAFLLGEITVYDDDVDLETDIAPEAVVRETVRKIGYTDPKYSFSDDCDRPFHADLLEVENHLTGQGGEIEESVGEDKAGDQGLMFGYATNETPEFMPLPIQLAHKLVKGLAEDRRDSSSVWLRPDAKSMVSVEYEDQKPKRVQTVLVSTQHKDGSLDTVKEYVRDELVPREIGDRWIDGNTDILVNTAGDFTDGGPAVDAGATGRKIIVDTYGGWGRHGGGAFSGKDPTKVDRSGAYFTRFVARNIVEAGLADRVEVQVSYAISEEDKISLHVDTFGTGDDRKAFQFARQFDYSPGNMIERLDLRRPIYEKTAKYGHFGKPGLSWEQTAEEVNG